MNELFLANILSCIGALFLLIGMYARKNAAIYGAVNFIGATFLACAAILLANIGFLILNVVWIGIGLKIFLKSK